MSARPLWALGLSRPRDGAQRAKRSRSAASQRQPVTFVFALIVAQGVHLYRGETAEAIMLGDEIIALCREYEFPQEAEWARGFQGLGDGRAGAHRRDGAAQLARQRSTRCTRSARA